ncbi:HEAT repeat domain-containing protein [Streptomyces sp. NBC_00236]|uniref:HEAT repeat domain-containing protein n=1 Tax=Streptomyces sp. NBC_00236 TaxID=2903639 RepID=UPI002E29C13C|nr:HEAT repeat domain-containing protein [Streptomyces sp. NBC_00236]
MINELDSIDWSSMSHAYGPAVEVPVWLRAMASPDPEVRDKAFNDFHNAAHHQGDVYPCTAASLPYLFAMADDAETPDRASIVRLLLSIGRESADRSDGLSYSPEGTESTAGADSLALIRERADIFISHSSHPDASVRQPAIEGLGHFLEDADHAVALLRDRLSAERGIVERLLVVRTMADLALRLPAARSSATSWLDTLAGEATADPDIRLAALVHKARCSPASIGAETVPTAISLLRQLTPAPQPEPRGKHCEAGPDACACAAEPATTTGQDVPAQIVAAFADLERHNRVHAPTTDLLRRFHAVLDARLPERTALLAEQLRSPDPATRYDAIRMAKDLIASWRGEHTGLVMLLTECLLPEDPYTAAAAAEVLGSLPLVSEPAREALADYIDAHRAVYGSDVWASPHPLRRRAHQEAVMALARLGDVRALPCLLTALDTGCDAWRAVQVAGHLSSAAEELVPRLARLLTEADLSKQWPETDTGALISALAELRHPAGFPALTHAVSAAARHEHWSTATSAVNALASFGPGAAPALMVIRPLTGAEDVNLRAAAAIAVWELGRNAAESVPGLEALLDSHCNRDAADTLGRIGPPAQTALPRLRELLDAKYEWTRVHAAAALWDIGGEAEADIVVQTLLAAWEENDATGNHVLACLDRMGQAAAPALPRIQAELALPRRGGRFRSVDNDAEVQRLCRTILTRLHHP